MVSSSTILPMENQRADLRRWGVLEAVRRGEMGRGWGLEGRTRGKGTYFLEFLIF